MAGMIVEVNGSGPPGFRDYTPALLYGTLTVKRYTLDFAVIDPAATVTGFNVGDLEPGQPVRIAALDWQGTIASVESSDLDDLIGHVVYTISAITSITSSNFVKGSTQTLSDTPTTVTDDYLLEDGSGTYLLEDGTLTQPGSYEMEGALATYSTLRVRTQSNSAIVTTQGQTFSIGPLTIPTASTQGSLVMYTGGLWPGTQFTLISTNQSIASVVYTVTETIVTFLTPTDPVFTVQFGLSPSDLPWNLNTWKKV